MCFFFYLKIGLASVQYQVVYCIVLKYSYSTFSVEAKLIFGPYEKVPRCCKWVEKKKIRPADGHQEVNPHLCQYGLPPVEASPAAAWPNV